MATEKTCFKCQETKPLADFYKHPAMGDGHLGKCKECAKKDVRENRAANLDYYREYDIKRFKEPERRAYQAKVLKLMREKYPHKALARGAVSNALRAGRLVSLPCWACGSMETEAHHYDYSMPLEVTWLCKKHHWELHNMAKKA